MIVLLGSQAGLAADADKRDPEPASPPPAPAPIDQAFCTRRDITPEQYAEKCVIKNGPPHRPVHRQQQGMQRAPGGAR